MANASVKLIMRPSKRRADGTAPVYVRAIYARQAKEATTGVWIEPKAWNPAKQEVRKSHPLAKTYNAKLEDILNKARAGATRARSAADVIARLDGLRLPLRLPPGLHRQAHVRQGALGE